VDPAGRLLLSNGRGGRRRAVAREAALEMETGAL
jgi:hypothetical protein